MLAVRGQEPRSEQSQTSDSRGECQQSHEEIASARLPSVSELLRNEGMELKAPREHRAAHVSREASHRHAERFAEKEDDVCEGQSSQ